MTARLGEHFFRHEYGRLVSMLARRVGVRHLEAVEDAVQAALLAAVESWPRSAVPENPSAWLYRVAHNHLAGELRREIRHGELAERHAHAALEPTDAAPGVLLSGELRDDLLSSPLPGCLARTCGRRCSRTCIAAAVTPSSRRSTGTQPSNPRRARP